MVTSPRASSPVFKIAPPAFYGDIAEIVETDDLTGLLQSIIQWQRLTVEVLNHAMVGKINAVGTLTLTINVASTTMTDSRLGARTAVILVPTTANASAEIGAGTIYQTYPNATKEQAVITHANNAQADRTFAFALLG